jgi:hypothetical protein
VTCTVLQALANSFTFTKKWSVDLQQQYQVKLLDYLELNQDEAPAMKGGKAKTPYLWSFLQTKFKGSIKGACLQFVAAFITEMPREIVVDHIKYLAPAVFGLVSEQNPIL